MEYRELVNFSYVNVRGREGKRQVARRAFSAIVVAVKHSASHKCANGISNELCLTDYVDNDTEGRLLATAHLEVDNVVVGGKRVSCIFFYEIGYNIKDLINSLDCSCIKDRGGTNGSVA